MVHFGSYRFVAETFKKIDIDLYHIFEKSLVAFNPHWLLVLNNVNKFSFRFISSSGVLHEHRSFKLSVTDKRANLKTEVTRNQSTSSFLKNNISYPPDTHSTRTCAYQGVRNVRFLTNLARFVFLLPPFCHSSFCLNEVNYTKAKKYSRNKAPYVNLF